MKNVSLTKDGSLVRIGAARKRTQYTNLYEFHKEDGGYMEQDVNGDS